MLENIMIACFFLAGFDYLFFGKVLITYQFTETELRVILLKLFPLHIIPLKIVEKVEKISYPKMFAGMAIYVSAFRSRAFGGGVLIRTSTKHGNEVVVTPPRVDEFISEVKRRVGEKTRREI